MGARARIEAYLADTPPSQRALKFFDWVVAWAESKDFRGYPLQHTVTELTDAAHPARAIAHGQREWFAERFREWTAAAGVKDPKATARALMVLFDGRLRRPRLTGRSGQPMLDGWPRSSWPADVHRDVGDGWRGAGCSIARRARSLSHRESAMRVDWSLESHGRRV
jgi:hypothetical protein